jgi:hypothetical protein
MKKKLFATAGIAAYVLASGLVLSAQRPNSYVTPGKARNADVCKADYAASVKPIAGWQRTEALKRYGKDPSSFDGELVYFIPASLGGSNDPDNLWPMPDNKVYGIADKKALDEKLLKMVCAGEISLKDAQNAIKKDWTKAYDQYVKNAPVPASN